LIFSAAHLHSSVPNLTGKTRFSIDYRTVNLKDLKNEIGAPNQDSLCTGTTMLDYLNVGDLGQLPSEVVEHYMAGHPQKPALV